MLKIRKFWEILFGLKYFFHAKLKFNFHIPLTVWFLLRNEKQSQIQDSNVTLFTVCRYFIDPIMKILI